MYIFPTKCTSEKNKQECKYVFYNMKETQEDI